ncbi:MAG: YegP family protein [Bacteroidales bacterium]|nr:YegP family protein [Bacteroidales bacterium]
MNCFIGKAVWHGIASEIIREDECFEYWLYDAYEEQVIFVSFNGYKTHDLALHFPSETNLQSGYHKFLELAVDIDYYHNIEKDGKYGFELHTEKAQKKASGGFEIFKGKNEQHYFRLKAGNHEIILQSEAYKSLQSCKNGIKSVCANALDDTAFERRVAKNNQPYFVLKAKNGEIIGVSETYVSIAGMENGIRSVKENAVAEKATTSVNIEAVHPFYYDTAQEREDRNGRLSIM